jgi:alkanesulfonate monooxygenase SsuD/methylene tetrahydromethanopterin reductase-like flavin-dependent oxidoreductase (luciferase family)
MLEIARVSDGNPAFESVWVGDSIGAKPRMDSLALLGALAGVTTRLKLGVGCMASFPVRDPIIFAYQWASLDEISRGRMLLAVCTGIVRGGASMREGKPWGVIDAERPARMNENIEIVRKLWSGEPTSFEGKYHRFTDAVVLPRPVQDPCPIWIAANPSIREDQTVERVAARIARRADGWMTTDLFPGSLQVMVKRVSEALSEHGRDPNTFPNIVYHNININDDAEAAYQESKKFLDAYYGPVFAEPQVRSWTAMGSPTKCIEQIQTLIANGAQSITLRITAWDQWGQYRRLVDHVLPAFA